MIKKILKPLYVKYLDYKYKKRNKKAVEKRNKYLQKMRKDLTNTNFSLIANNCDGGVISHNLGLKFLSPTVNLWMEDDDYILFLSNLKQFLQSPVEEVLNSGYDYPVGKISCPCGNVKLLFMHYKTFAEAKQKWEERAKRVNLDNLVVMYEAEYSFTEKNISDFINLPFEKKVIVTTNKNLRNELTFNIDVKEYHHGKLLNYKGKFSDRRFLDDFDYVSFINDGSIKKNKR